MKRVRLSFRLASCLSLALLATVPSAWPQTSPFLSLQTIQVTQSGPVQFTFRDDGTGATNYLAQFSPTVGAGANWQVSSNAVLTALGGGIHRVNIANPQGPTGFYRVVALAGAGGPILIEFSTVAFQVVEGDTATPMLVLNQPFNGTVFYSVSGTAESGDYVALSGQVAVNGATATIPVLLNDNGTIGRLRDLILRLEPGPGYELAGNSQTTITIDENDADWEGTFLSGNSVIPFLLKVTQPGGEPARAILASDRFGFFPTNEVPLTLTLSENTFFASAASIPVPAEATLFALPLVQRLDLAAANGDQGQEVGPDRIQGNATLITTVPAATHLNATNHGTFVLSKSPVRPSTNEVQLVSVP
jgi:hypothetical protein